MSDTFTPPAAAQRNAQRVLRWREEHPDEIRGMTSVGWLRASQLASGRPISLDIVKRMAQFNRHRPNARVAQEHVKAPWRDAGRVAWLGWGGDEGIDWALTVSAENTETKSAGATPTGVMGHGPGGIFSMPGLATDERHKAFDRAAVIIPLDAIHTQAVKVLQRVFAPEDLTGQGLELEPHITVSMLPASADLGQVAAILEKFAPFEVRFTGISLFERDEYDVVKVDVEGGDLRELQARLARAFPQEDGYLIYRPHVTLAYVRKGAGKRYLFDPLPARAMRVHGVLFSPADDKEKVFLPFGIGAAIVARMAGERAAQTAQKSAEITKLHNGQQLPASAFLVIGDPEQPSTWRLPVRGADGKPDRRLMGAAHAALTVGFRGQTYSGPQKGRALAALKRMYAELDSAETTKPDTSPGPSIKAPDVYEALKKRGMSKASAAAISNAMAARRHKAARPLPSLVVFKDKRGDWRWVSISSSAFRDRDGEIVSTKALADDCARADKDGNYGVLRFWHMPGVDLGDCDFNVLRGRVLIESGTFRSPLIAQRVAEKSADYQISLGFRHPVEQPGKDGVFTTIRRFERSLVPIGRASNPFTSISVKRS